MSQTFFKLVFWACMYSCGPTDAPGRHTWSNIDQCEADAVKWSMEHGSEVTVCVPFRVRINK